MSRVVCPIVAMLLFVSERATAVSTLPPVPSLEQSEFRDRICGPQCVKRILEHYGYQVGLEELIRELQWPEIDKGTSLGDLSQALEKRGLHVRAIAYPEDVPIRWSHPVVLHFEQGEVGHFAVLFPSEDGEKVVLWSPGVGSLPFRTDVCFEKRTNAVLLTAPFPITDSQVEALPRGKGIIYPIAFGFSLLLPVLVLYRLCRSSPA
jgi:ABC-type bacteriocin/lantibiotic exporter with double-glycine peptidase domain